MRWRSPLLAALLLAVALPSQAGTGDRRARRFQIAYMATVSSVPANAKLVRIWLPYPTSDAWQTVSNVSIDSPASYSIGRETEYGNGVLYLEAHPPLAADLKVSMRFDVVRREDVNRPDGAHAPHAAESAQTLARFRKADRLIPLGGRVAEVAAQVTKGRRSDRDKARAIYDYVTTHLRYDKSGTGWGRGDAVWACDARRGNCTDFHSLLIGMARAVGIPAKFEIGLPLPENATAGTIAGYHCWAELYLDGVGWVPMDSSEASQAPAKRDYFFGAVDPNRVRLTVGRDLSLTPRQAAGPLNYFVYPYVEVDGKPFAHVTQAFTFRDLPR